MRSYIADNIMKEYKKEKRVKERKEFQEFINTNCNNCKNKNTDLCHITRNINNKLQCVFKEI